MGEKLLLLCAGALIGVLFSFIANSYFHIRSQQINHISDFLKDLELLELAAIDYWLHSSINDWQKQVERSSVLKGRYNAASTFIDQAAKLLASRYPQIQELDQQLFYATTDGTFETKMQVQDPQRVEQIISICSQLRYELRDFRWRLFWAH